MAINVEGFSSEFMQSLTPQERELADRDMRRTMQAQRNIQLQASPTSDRMYDIARRFHRGDISAIEAERMRDRESRSQTVSRGLGTPPPRVDADPFATPERSPTSFSNFWEEEQAQIRPTIYENPFLDRHHTIPPLRYTVDDRYLVRDRVVTPDPFPSAETPFRPEAPLSNKVALYPFNFRRLVEGDTVVLESGDEVNQIYVFDFPDFTPSRDKQYPIVALIWTDILRFSRDGSTPDRGVRLYMKYRTKEEEFI